MYGIARFTSFEMCERFIRDVQSAGLKAWMIGDGTNTVQWIKPESKNTYVVCDCTTCYGC